MKKIQKPILLLFFCFLWFVLISCNNTNQNVPTKISNGSANAFSQTNSNNAIQSESSEMKEAKFENYNYQYIKLGEKTVAMFTEKLLPRDDKIVVGAIRSVIEQSYEDNATGSPSLKNHGGINKMKIHIESKKSDYYVTPVTEDTGEVHSLEIEREAK